MPIGSLFFPHGEFRSHVLIDLVRQQWFVRLRWIIVGCTLAVLAAEHFLVPQFQRPWPVMVGVGVLGLSNIAWTIVGRRLLRGSELTRQALHLRKVVRFVNAQMVTDLLILTVLLRYTGGVENPMSMFYLFHVLMAALLLRPVNALLQGLWALALFGGLAIAEAMAWLSPHFPLLATSEGSLPHTDVGYVAAGIVVLAAGVFGTLYFTLQISARLDDQERQLERSNLALRRAHRTMEQLYARRSRFMRTAAHQLKSPFATIETLAGLLRDEAVDAATSKDLVRRIIGRCRMGVEVVSELLTLARVEETARAAASGAPARCAAIGSVVRRLNERFAVQAKARGIALGVSCEACAEDQVTVDERDLEDCLGNLLDNALKYTGEGGRAELQVERQGPDIVISVTDTGMGIAGKNLEEIFEPFCRGPQALAAGIPGTGLGLTIVREIVERAGGRIEVRSKVGEGSRFTVRLPRLGQTAACQKAAEAGQPGAVRIVPEAVAADRQG